MNDIGRRRDAMRDALRLVRGGQLRAATQLIQDTLRRTPAVRTPASTPAVPTPALPQEAEDAVFSDEAVAATSVPDQPEVPAVPVSVTFLGATPPQLRRAPPAPPPVHRRPRPFAPHAVPSRLDYRLALPAADGSRRPLLVMLHGCQQDAADFARGTGMERMAVAQGYIVAYPEQAAGANPSGCWNWFRPQDQRRGQGEPAALMQVIDEIAAQHPVDATRIYAAGLSAGAAMAVILAAAYPDRIAAVGAHSGLAYAAAGNVPSAFSAMRGAGVAPALPAADGAPSPFVPLLVLHGDGDTIVAPRNAELLLAQWLAAVPRGAEWRRDEEAASGGARAARRTTWRAPDGRRMLEHWRIAGAGHAWSGGDRAGSFTDPEGPDASAILLDFFAQHAQPQGG